MPRYKLTIEYAGTRYSGWQIQKNARTVQGELAAAIRELAQGRTFELYGSGRTDAGVHALAQVAHLDFPRSLPPDSLVRRINEALPADINVLRAERVPSRFHARRDAVSRAYLYQIARRRTAFGKAFVWWVREPLDVEAMRQAAAPLVGFHDFRAFTADEPDETSTRVQLTGIELREHGPYLLIRVRGSHFLWKMVRRLVGVLVEAGLGRLPPEDVPALLDGPSDLPARLTAPASGLFLERVLYPGDRLEGPPMPVLNV